MALDLTGLNFFVPLLGFLFVFIIIFVILQKTKILGENKFVQVFISFFISIVFITVSSARTYVETVIPWFAVLIILLFFILILVGMSQKKIEDLIKPWFVWVFIILLIIIFLVAAVEVFGPLFSPYAPGGVNSGEIYSTKVFGGILLIIITAVVSWVITREIKKK